MADADMRRRIAAVAPHARRALLINKTIDATASETSTFADILNGLSAAIFLIDGSCRIVHANQAGHDIVGAGDVLRTVNGQLVARDAQVNQTLRKAFSVPGKVATEAACIALPMTGLDGERYVAHFLPLTAAARGVTGAAYKSVAALFVRKVAMDTGGQRTHRAQLRPDAGRVARDGVHRRCGGRTGDGHRARCRRIHRQDPSAPRIRQDRRQPSGGSRQDRSRLFQPAGALAAAAPGLRRTCRFARLCAIVSGARAGMTKVERREPGGSRLSLVLSAWHDPAARILNVDLVDGADRGPAAVDHHRRRDRRCAVGDRVRLRRSSARRSASLRRPASALPIALSCWCCSACCGRSALARTACISWARSANCWCCRC